MATITPQRGPSLFQLRLGPRAFHGWEPGLAGPGAVRRGMARPGQARRGKAGEVKR